MLLESIALQMTPGVGSVGAAHLLEVFGDARAVFAASVDELIERAALRPALAAELVQRRAFSAAERELAYCRKHGITPIPATDEAYPPLLREIHDYPPVIYLQGDPSVLRKQTIAIVGTRSTTPYGSEQCRQLVIDLAQQLPRLAVVSSLAYGIDVGVHRAALECGARSIAVLANALPEISPTHHTDVARKILDQGGAIVSEVHSQSKQKGKFYIPRNRLIAGLAAGCVVAEAPANSGALTTARLADEYHRCVMAFPGRPADKNMFGANHLIRTHKAQMICSAADVVRELAWALTPTPAQYDRTPSDELPMVAEPAAVFGTMPEAPVADERLTEADRRLLACFEGSDPLSIEELQARSGLDIDQLYASLMGLEIAGRIRLFPGNKYLKRCD